MINVVSNRGLVIGRFQPPHNGHLSVIREILKKKREVIIVVAAAQLSHTSKNPLTAGERVTLIRLMLESENIEPSVMMISVITLGSLPPLSHLIVVLVDLPAQFLVFWPVFELTITATILNPLTFGAD